MGTKVREQGCPRRWGAVTEHGVPSDGTEAFVSDREEVGEGSLGGPEGRAETRSGGQWRCSGRRWPERPAQVASLWEEVAGRSQRTGKAPVGGRRAQNT